MSFKLPDLPYGYDALEPSVDAQTMQVRLCLQTFSRSPYRCLGIALSALTALNLCVRVFEGVAMLQIHHSKHHATCKDHRPLLWWGQNNSQRAYKRCYNESSWHFVRASFLLQMSPMWMQQFRSSQVSPVQIMVMHMVRNFASLLLFMLWQAKIVCFRTK